ncbi:MAG: hypothetical protein AAF570_08945 [Bacteroidota bacterium]
MDAYNQSGAENPRPTILTVFAILTLVGSGLFLLFAIAPIDLGVDQSSMRPEPPIWMKIGEIATLIAKIAGALLILRMMKIGFYVYAVAETILAVLIVISAKMNIDFIRDNAVIVDGPLSAEMLNLVSAGVMTVLTLVWIGVYATNLKHLK